jgi:hypothetical protein
VTELTFPRATRILEDRRSSICLVKHTLLNIASELSPALISKLAQRLAVLNKATAKVASNKHIASEQNSRSNQVGAETALSIARVADRFNSKARTLLVRQSPGIHPSQPTFTCGTDHWATAIG